MSQKRRDRLRSRNMDESRWQGEEVRLGMGEEEEEMKKEIIFKGLSDQQFPPIRCLIGYF